MRLQNRFKNRFISHQKWVEWFTARDFRASIVCTLAKFERRKHKKLQYA